MEIRAKGRGVNRVCVIGAGFLLCPELTSPLKVTPSWCIADGAAGCYRGIPPVPVSNTRARKTRRTKIIHFK